MGKQFKSIASFLWRWSLLVTVPVGAMFLVWVFRTATKYQDLGVEFETHNNHMSLLRIGRYEADGVIRDVQLAMRPKQLEKPSRLRTMELYVPESSERSLNGELPHSGRKYVPASLLYPNGELGEVRLRYRGDHFWHWGARKKSLRVKTKRSQLFERMRAMNFSVPKTNDLLAEQISNELALLFDLVGPKSELVDLRVNGSRRGVHLLVEQLEELVLRTNGKMPGDLYSADIVKRSNYTGVSNQVFKNPALWEKIAINNHFVDAEDANLRQLIDVLLAEPSQERTRSLRDIVDIDSFGRFAAFRTVCQTFHFDDTHNQRLYYDPWRNVFVPVVWDSLGWHSSVLLTRGEKPFPDVITSRLDEALFQDPEYLAARQRAFSDWFGSGKHEAFLERVDELIAQVDPSIDRDPGLGSMLTTKTPAEVREAQRVLREQIHKIAAGVRSVHMAAPKVSYVSEESVPNSVRLKVEEHAVALGVELSYEEPLDGPVQAYVSYYAPGGEVITADVSGQVEMSGAVMRLKVPFCAEVLRAPAEGPRVKERSRTGVEPATYQLTLRGGGIKSNRLIKLSTLNAAGELDHAERVFQIAPTQFVAMHEAVVAAPLGTTQRWSGEVVIEDVRTIHDDVIIEPGTAIRMGPGASVIFEGQVVARGSKAQPIQVGPIDGAQEPWGTFALRGEGADQSQLAWMEMRLGSGLMTKRAEYSAMLSIHAVADVTVQDCLFEDSRVVDDMVHAVYSKIRFERCTFVRSLMDALDIDISEAIVSECLFIESGNDALDLMTSTVVAVDVTTVRSVDKGVSVGEDTTAMLLRCSLTGGAIGIQMKDRSRAVILNSLIEGNVQGVDAYKKNWRYDSGGFASIYNSAIVDNEVQFGADKVSRMKVHDCFVSPRPKLGEKESQRIFFDRWCKGGSRTKARLRGPFQFPGEADESPSMFLPYWTAADPSVRGPGPRE